MLAGEAKKEGSEEPDSEPEEEEGALHKMNQNSYSHIATPKARPAAGITSHLRRRLHRLHRCRRLRRR